jgi:hypothetical protein
MNLSKKVIQHSKNKLNDKLTKQKSIIQLPHPMALLFELSKTCTSIGKLKYTDEFLIFITKIFLIVSFVGIGPW